MKSFSELTSASQVNNGDLLAISQTSGSGYASKKTTVKDITDKSNLNLAEEYDSTSTYAVDDYVIYESALYKCIASTTGTFDSTKWTSVVVTDEMGSGGGGGAGHTIKDDGGNALTQRSNLQFKGVYSHDDSTNSASVVEVARSMTWAEYQLLSASEKKGLITITDRYSADAMFVDGTFVDTNNVIQQSTSYSGSMTYTATQDCVVLIGWANKANDSVYVKIDGVNAISRYAGGITAGEDFIYLKKGQVLTVTNGYTDAATVYIVYGIQEGTNPSIPDYSTTEHKTGRKWIDGKDIWEKTFELTFDNFGSYNSIRYKSIDLMSVNDFDKIIDVSGYVITTSYGLHLFPTVIIGWNNVCNFIGYVQSNSNYLQATINFNTGNYSETSIPAKITVQYTKPTS